MIDLNTTNEWQHRCPETGLVFPWYVKSFLDELVTWDISDKVVFEYGAGASTLWWAKKAKVVRGVDSNYEYAFITSRIIGGMPVLHHPDKELYVDAPYYWRLLFDIIIIDGDPTQWRDACVQPALDCLVPGGRLIIDNWMQPSVGWMPSEETQGLVTSLPHVIYSQIGHPDWKTLVATKP